MPKFSADGVEIYCEVTGEGFPLVWSHEFGGSYESWKTQVRYFTRRYQVITYAASRHLGEILFRWRDWSRQLQSTLVYLEVLPDPSG